MNVLGAQFAKPQTTTLEQRKGCTWVVGAHPDGVLGEEGDVPGAFM